MKKKFLIVLLSLVCCFCLAFGFSACGLFGDSGSNSSTNSGSSSSSSTDDGTSSGGSSSNTDTTHTHTLAKTAAKDATCSKEGNIEYWYCSGCYKYFSDGNGTTEISLSDTVISKTEHTPAEAVKEDEVAATCGSDGSYNSVVYCSVCGEKISSETITIEATGKHTYNNSWTCSVCGYSEVTVSEGLAYTLSDDKTYYTVSGIGECTDTDIVIPYTYNDIPVTAIAASAFKNQTQLTSVYVPDSVTTIGKGAFSGCSSLESMTLPFVGGSASATSPSSSTLFGYIFGTTGYTGCTSTKQCYALGFSSVYYLPITLKILTITGGNLFYGAFYKCTSLENITISDNVTAIGDCAFYDCVSLESITIPDSVTSIGNSAFTGCTALTSITIPNSVISIGEWAFYGCTALTSVTIGDGIETIGKEAFYNTAYYNDTNNWENNVLYIDNYLIKADTSISGSYTMKEGTTVIAEYAFNYCSSLSSITIPDSVTSIGTSAFNYCSSLSSITIPDSVTSIGTSAFYCCSALTTIYFNATAMDDLSSSNYVFYNAGQSGDGIIVTIGANVTKIPAYLFCPYDSSSYAPKITSVVFEDNSVCDSIGNCAFYKCTSFTNITIPNSVTSIGISAYGGCTSLESITIGNGVTSIGEKAFYNTAYYNDSNNWVNNVLYLSNYLIAANTSISGSYTIKDGTTVIAGSAFYKCTSLTSVIV